MNRKRHHTEIFRKFGLDMIGKCGNPLSERANTRALVYDMANGESARLKTNINRVLIAKTDGPNMEAKLNLEETDWILLAMPEIKGALGPLAAYLLPTYAVVDAFRKSHEKWRSCPDTNTKGANMNRVLHFDDRRPGKPDKYESYGYAERWGNYRLNTPSYS